MPAAYQKDNIKKLYLLVGLRYLLITCCTIALFLQAGSWNFDNIPLYRFAWQLLKAIFVINCIYLVLIPLVSHFFLSCIVFQLLLDIIAETVLIYLTGGIFSVFTSLYFISIILSSVMISPNNSLVCASIATIGISGISLIYFLGAINNTTLPFLPRENFYIFLIAFDLPFCKAYLFAQAVSFYLVAFLSSRLTHALSRERILQKEILQNLTDGVLVVDSKQHIVFINQSAMNMLGIRGTSPLEGTDITRLVNHKDIIKVAKIQQPCYFESQIINEKQTIPVHLTVSTITSFNKIRAVIIILRDITQQKQMEEAIRQANRMAITSEIAATIAHEIRNPLTSIRGAIQELQEVIPPNDPHYILMNITIRESDRINRIITDFLDFSRIRPPTFQKCNLSQILQEVLLLLKRRSEMANQDIQSEIEQDIIIRADSEQLKQVFYNLGINAIEASDLIDIRVVARQKSEGKFTNQYVGTIPGVEVSFHDRGKGISNEERRKIFTPFYTTKPKGTGMGLAFVSRILEFHRGVYRIDSEVGKGTNFYIWLPKDPETVLSLGRK